MRPALLLLCSLLVVGCATAVPTRDADLAALDSCSAHRDTAYTSLRTSVAAALDHGHPLVAVIGAFSKEQRLAEATPGGLVGLTLAEARYMTQMVDGNAGNAARANRDRLPALRQCLTAKGYTFTEGR